MNFKFILFSFVILCLYQNIDAQKLENADCKCRLPANRRIVGGREVRAPVPWMVSLAFWSDERGLYSHFCGGTIINRRQILTAAHCAAVLKNRGDINKIQVRVGMVELNQTRGIQRFGAISFKIHNKYKLGERADQLGDIAVIQIDGNIQFNENVQPGCFQNSDAYEDFSDKIGGLHAVGFGLINSYLIDTRNNRRSPVKLTNRLKEAFFNDQSATKPGCHDYLICIKQTKYPDSTCNGDSGSGLMHHTVNGLTRIVGINSFGWNKRVEESLYRACVGESGFSRISTYHSLLKDVTDNDFCIVTIRR